MFVVYPFLLLLEHKVSYLDHFKGSITGSAFITSYKLYFHADQSQDSMVTMTTISPLGILYSMAFLLSSCSPPPPPPPSPPG